MVDSHVLSVIANRSINTILSPICCNTFHNSVTHYQILCTSILSNASNLSFLACNLTKCWRSSNDKLVQIITSSRTCIMRIQQLTLWRRAAQTVESTPPLTNTWNEFQHCKKTLTLSFVSLNLNLPHLYWSCLFVVKSNTY